MAAGDGLTPSTRHATTSAAVAATCGAAIEVPMYPAMSKRPAEPELNVI